MKHTDQQKNLPKIKQEQGVFWLPSFATLPILLHCLCKRDIYRKPHLNASNELSTMWMIYVKCKSFCDEGLALSKAKLFKVTATHPWLEFEFMHV